MSLITFIFGRCLRSSAAATPVKYDRDIIYVTCVLIILKNRENNGTEEIGLVTSTQYRMVYILQTFSSDGKIISDSDIIEICSLGSHRHQASMS